jgi:hypothetical protein
MLHTFLCSTSVDGVIQHTTKAFRLSVWYDPCLFSQAIFLKFEIWCKLGRCRLKTSLGWLG